MQSRLYSPLNLKKIMEKSSLTPELAKQQAILDALTEKMTFSEKEKLRGVIDFIKDQAALDSTLATAKAYKSK